MKIHEYQARNLFRKYGIPVPDGVVCHTVEEVKERIPDDNKLRVIKAQVHVGGRGKAGGVKLAKTKAEAIEKAGQILGMDIKGHTVHGLMAEAMARPEHELYLSISLNGEGGKKRGPELDNIGNLLSAEEIAIKILDPKSYKAEGFEKEYEKGKMPDKYKDLMEHKDVQALAGWLASYKNASVNTPKPIKMK